MRWLFIAAGGLDQRRTMAFCYYWPCRIENTTRRSAITSRAILTMAWWDKSSANDLSLPSRKETTARQFTTLFRHTWRRWLRNADSISKGLIRAMRIVGL